VLCKRKADLSCEFYDLVDDPLEESPLDQPTDCSANGRTPPEPSNPASNFCFLRRALDRDSTLGDSAAPTSRPEHKSALTVPRRYPSPVA
jgi:hypothetical protein